MIAVAAQAPMGSGDKESRWSGVRACPVRGRQRQRQRRTPRRSSAVTRRSPAARRQQGIGGQGRRMGWGASWRRGTSGPDREGKGHGPGALAPSIAPHGGLATCANRRRPVDGWSVTGFRWQHKHIQWHEPFTCRK
jgi:hypothetical protein